MVWDPKVRSNTCSSRGTYCASSLLIVPAPLTFRYVLPLSLVPSFADDIWLNHVFNTIDETYHHEENAMTNGALPAVGSGYFAACWESHLSKDDVDIVFLEVGSLIPQLRSWPSAHPDHGHRLISCVHLLLGYPSAFHQRSLPRGRRPQL